MRRVFVVAVVFWAAIQPRQAVALPEETVVWVSVRGAIQFFSDRDYSDLEAAATELSDPLNNRPVEFNDKPWEVTFGVRLGLVISPTWSFLLTYERCPYQLETDAAELDVTDINNPRTDTVQIDAPANLWGLGLDYGFYSSYSSSFRLGLVGGLIDMDGGDRDLVYRRNFILSGDSYFIDFYGAVDWEFNDELSFHPYLQYRFGRVSEAIATDSRSPVETWDEPLEIDYSGFSVGIELRIRAIPFGPRD